jgi:hypothetical protein
MSPTPGRERLKSMGKQSRGPRDARFNAVVLLGAVATGAATDLVIRAFGVMLPPVFTAFWGGGAALLLVAGATNKRRKRAQEDRLKRRVP